MSESLATLVTARLRLRPFVAADAPAVQRLAAAAEVASTTATLPHPYPDGAAAAWIAGHEAARAAGRSLDWAITTAADGVVGAIALHPSAAHLNAELGYWIGVPYWRRGYASEAAAALVRHGLRVLAFKRIHAHHMSGNPASGRVLQNAGMRWEGRLRSHLRRDGRFHDVELWGVLDADLDAPIVGGSAGVPPPSFVNG
ncbi:MAG: GNAT family N-acetyltransferase [Planctomycetes bacterium]|nr:GNAT family N-acetyltransferase [Planctomycetota bacterium]